MDGIINIYKEAGYTSFDVVAKLRGILKQKKIGHAGTLDPDAEGVLVVCVGKATKICEYLTDRDKTYETVLRLGVTTDTQDMSGTVLEEKPVRIGQEELLEIIRGFAGKSMQVPPMYSAIKVGGKKLCDLARKGIEVERKAREIEIYSIDVLSVDMPLVAMRVHCSKGTYIRALCHDIGAAAGCGGCMEKLLRVKAGGFSVKDSVRLNEVEAIARGRDEKGRTLSDILLPMDEALKDYPKVIAKKGMEKTVWNGGSLSASQTMQGGGFADGLYRIYDAKNAFIGLFQYDNGEDRLRPRKMFV